MSISFIDNTEKVLEELRRQTEAGLEAIGHQAVSYAKNTITASGRIGPTGRLRNGIKHQVDKGEKTVYIGTNVKYAIYHEMGTGIYIAGGRKSPWAYRDAKGNWHMTRGVSPLHFLKKAAEGHGPEYKAIMEQYYRNG